MDRVKSYTLYTLNKITKIERLNPGLTDEIKNALGPTKDEIEELRGKIIENSSLEGIKRKNQDVISD